jgi:hypothetical protein
MEASFWRCGGSKTYCEEAGFRADCCPSLQPSASGWYGVASPAIYSCATVPHECSAYAQMAIMCDSAAELEQPLSVQLECTREDQPTVKVQKEVWCARPVDLHGEEVPWNSGYACNITVDASGSRNPTSRPSSIAAPQPGFSTLAPTSPTPVPEQSQSWLSVAVIIVILVISILGLLVAARGGARKGGYQDVTLYE